jgi:hypothetical protein
MSGANAVAAAFGFALAPSGSGIDDPPKAPLVFRSLARGSATGGVLELADNFARIFGLGPKTVKAVDLFDDNHHFSFYILRRGQPVSVRRLLLRRLNAKTLGICVFVRDVTGTTTGAYGYQALWVRKTFGINHVVPLLDTAYPVIFDARGKLLYPVPRGNVRPGVCR